MSFFRSSPAPSVKSTTSTRTSSVIPSPHIRNEPQRPALPAGEHLELYESFLAHFAAPAFEVGGKGLSGAERMWLTDACFLRYLRAQKWDLEIAQQKLIDTLLWRREHGLADDDGGERSKEEGGGLNAELVKSEGRSGKDYVNGWDEDGRPLHYQVPSRNESSDSNLNILYCVWVMERSIDLMPAGVEKQVLLVNFSGGMSPPPLATVRGWIQMLSAHYPERMEKAIAIKVPWILNQFFKLILPWIDPVTRGKLTFNAPAPWVPQEQLEEPFGGNLPFDYNQDTYLPSLLALCSERRRLYRERWVKEGSKIGASEWILKGGAVEPGEVLPLSSQPTLVGSGEKEAADASVVSALEGLKVQ